MKNAVQWRSFCGMISVIIHVIRGEYSSEDKTGRLPAPDFTNHIVIKPHIFHDRDKREIQSNRKDEEDYPHHVTVEFQTDEKHFVLDLQLNSDLIPESYFEKSEKDGNHTVIRPVSKDLHFCHYQGKLRGVSKSWAAISTCDGLSGVIFDGSEVHYIERVRGAKGLHFLYKHSDLKSNNSCGFLGAPNVISGSQEYHKLLRNKRATVRGPHNANKKSRYVELVLVVDYQEYRKNGEEKAVNICRGVANIVNALYAPLNIFIILVGVVIWKDGDKIEITSDAQKTLDNFLGYRKQSLLNENLLNDNAQLLTRVSFGEGIIGKASIGSICTYKYSGGINAIHSEVVGLVASTVAHELGHNFGMDHDSAECTCPKDTCIMAPSLSYKMSTTWSSCNEIDLAITFDRGLDYCLRNKPESIFNGPVCGNGFLDTGEECDCGLEDYCDNPCCNATSCMLYANASCATGECCDLETCTLQATSTLCRSADYECDLPEYCTGHSEFCPDDVFKMNGEPCTGRNAFCYDGSCSSHDDQCKLLWGPSGRNCEEFYRRNKDGNIYGNCGYNPVRNMYAQCDDADVLCGRLHCKHSSEGLVFGKGEVASTAMNKGGKNYVCQSAVLDVGLSDTDPGLVPNGATCGEGKMCVNQKCISVASVRNGSACPQNCGGNGVCNSRGRCHCDVGFSPPSCHYPGPGGSEDSGPASDPRGLHGFVTGMYILFLGIVPLVALALLLYHAATTKNTLKGRNQYVSCSKVCSWIRNVCASCMGGGPGSSQSGSKHAVVSPRCRELKSLLCCVDVKHLSVYADCEIKKSASESLNEQDQMIQSPDTRDTGVADSAPSDCIPYCGKGMASLDFQSANLLSAAPVHGGKYTRVHSPGQMRSVLVNDVLRRSDRNDDDVGKSGDDAGKVHGRESPTKLSSANVADKIQKLHLSQKSHDTACHSDSKTKQVKRVRLPPAPLSQSNKPKYPGSPFPGARHRIHVYDEKGDSTMAENRAVGALRLEEGSDSHNSSEKCKIQQVKRVQFPPPAPPGKK